MDENIRQSLQEESPLRKFQNEIANLKRKEKKLYELHGVGESNHFSDINPEDLTLADMIIWNIYKENRLTEKVMNEYTESVSQESGGLTNSRTQFRAMMNNMILAWNKDGTPYSAFDAAFKKLEGID